MTETRRRITPIKTSEGKLFYQVLAHTRGHMRPGLQDSFTALSGDTGRVKQTLQNLMDGESLPQGITIFSVLDALGFGEDIIDLIRSDRPEFIGFYERKPRKKRRSNKVKPTPTRASEERRQGRPPRLRLVKTRAEAA